MVSSGNMLSGLPQGALPDEAVDTLLAGPHVRIERIVSTGQATPEGEWYDQDDDEWVLLVSGAARLKIEGEERDRSLQPGDWLLLPAHCRHRVTWMEAEPATVWLAIHLAKAE
jgi:cupin 2 domain-containing protein